MTLRGIELLIAVGALFLAGFATALRVSPWPIFGLAGITTVVLVAVAAHIAGERCGSGRTAAGQLFDITIVLSLIFYGAAALRAVVDGIALAKSGDREAAVSRCVSCPLASALGVGVVLYSFLLAISSCLD
jgi:hypothetical protein